MCVRARVCLSVCLSVCLFLYVYMCVCLSVYLFLYVYLCVRACMCVRVVCARVTFVVLCFPCSKQIWLYQNRFVWTAIIHDIRHIFLATGAYLKTLRCRHTSICNRKIYLPMFVCPTFYKIRSLFTNYDVYKIQNLTVMFHWPLPQYGLIQQTINWQYLRRQFASKPMFWENKKNISKCRLLTFLPSMQSVKFSWSFKHGTLQTNEIIKIYYIRHLVSFDGGDNLGFLRLQ